MSVERWILGIIAIILLPTAGGGTVFTNPEGCSLEGEVASDQLGAFLVIDGVSVFKSMEYCLIRHPQVFDDGTRQVALFCGEAGRVEYWNVAPRADGDGFIFHKRETPDALIEVRLCE